MRDHRKREPIVNCGYYGELLGIMKSPMGREYVQLGTFHKGQIAQTEGNKSLVKE